MTALIWDAPGSRKFELGIDKGVLYIGEDPGVAWNGLVSISEKKTGADMTPHYFDGRRYFDHVTRSEYTATIKAMTYPFEFTRCEGFSENETTGLVFDNQIQQTFGLSYRSLIGNDTEELSHGYKIHIVYGLTAIPVDIDHETLSDDVDPIPFEWEVSAVPQEEIANFFPTAHIIIDTSRVASDALLTIENILYGTEFIPPRLLTIEEILAIPSSIPRVNITDNGDGTWSATSEYGYVLMTDENYFRVTAVPATYLDTDTYTIEST